VRRSVPVVKLICNHCGFEVGLSCGRTTSFGTGRHHARALMQQHRCTESGGTLATLPNTTSVLDREARSCAETGGHVPPSKMVRGWVERKKWL
jgi:hypothetical protein